MKKKTMAIAATMASCIALSATFTGCSLVSLNSKADMDQIIATVDISKSDKFNDSGLKEYQSALASSSVVKRDLVSYFLNVGYSQIQNGSSYADTFNMLLDALINNEVLIQYSTLELLKAKANGSSAATVVKEFNALSEDKKYEYLLDEEDIVYAQYKLYSSLNSAIDNYEKTIIDEDNEYSGTETRTTPVNLNTENDDFYPTKDGKLDYFVYTGYETKNHNYTLKNSGIYEEEDALEGTTTATRKKAYNSFLNSLRRNNLVDGVNESENLTDILELDYVKNEYVSQLQSRVINKYYDTYEDEQAKKLQDDQYVINRYTEMLEYQTEQYDSTSAFETAMGNMSSTSFILYSPKTDDSDKFDGTRNGKFGFVYNILLPFDAKQSAELAVLNSMKSQDEDENYYFEKRNELLKDIKTVDQRSAWFNGKTDYSFKVEGSKFTEKYFGQDKGRDYLFFEDSLTDSGEGARYKKLQAYDGRYSYNGKVLENENGSYTLIGNKLDIDGMLDEFSAYINFVLSDGAANPTNKVNFENGYKVGQRNEAYYQVSKFDTKEVEGEEDNAIDYAHFLYASGKVEFSEKFNNANLLLEGEDQYKVMSAVNELQFAYTTDTSVLSQYVGYSVSAYDTSYIKEFEYAAKKAIADGAGAFAVCAGDYGWHLIYVTYAFEAGNTYTPNWDNMHKEGTFENLFFEWIKSTSISDVTTKRRNVIVNDFNTDSTVEKFEKRYKDLLDLDNSANNNTNNGSSN